MNKQIEDKLQELAKENAVYPTAQDDIIVGMKLILEHPEQWFEIVDCEDCYGTGIVRHATMDTLSFRGCPSCKGEKKIIKLKS